MIALINNAFTDVVHVSAFVAVFVDGARGAIHYLCVSAHEHVDETMINTALAETITGCITQKRTRREGRVKR